MSEAGLPMGFYEKQLYIPFRDCDASGRVSLRSWLSYLAELAGDQYEQRDLGRDQLLSQNQVFLVSSFSLHFLRHPRAYETLTASTWEKGLDAVFFRRNYDFYDQSGLCAAEASSLWLLCDPVRHRILRPSALGHEVPDIDRPIDCPFPEKIQPFSGGEELGRHTVRYSDLDVNLHIYCANYGSIIMDYLPGDVREKPFERFTLNYVKEATLGETISLKGLKDNSSYTVTGTHENGGLCFAARMSF